MNAYGEQTLPQFVSWHCQNNEVRERKLETGKRTEAEGVCIT